jgi:hypothetical protein
MKKVNDKRLTFLKDEGIIKTSKSDKLFVNIDKRTMNKMRGLVEEI